MYDIHIDKHKFLFFSFVGGEGVASHLYLNMQNILAFFFQES